MRIAMVCPYSLSRPGGVQGQVIGLARSLRQLGHDVTVVAPDDDRPIGAQPEVDHLVVVGRSFTVSANGSVVPLAVSPAAVARAARVVRRGQFDLVHLHEPLAPAINYGCLLRSPVPVVGTFHRAGSDTLYRVAGPVLRLVAHRLAIRCAVSDEAKDTAQQALGGQYRVLFNGIDVDRFALPPVVAATQPISTQPTSAPSASAPASRADADRQPTVLFLSRHEPRKGLEVLLDAFSAVTVPAVLWVASDGPETERLRQRHPPSSRVHWLGRLSDDEVVTRLAAADVLCAPSLGGEAYGVVLLEAMATGCVVVASDLVAYRQVVGDFGHLVPPGDAAALAGALGHVLADVVARRGLASPDRLAEARSYAETRSMAALARAYVDVYEQALTTRTSTTIGSPGGRRRRG